MSYPTAFTSYDFQFLYGYVSVSYGQIIPCPFVNSNKGTTHQDSEYQLVIKTDLALFEQIVAHVTQQHSYDLPEIIAVPITESTQEYAQWVREQLK
ncbi:divalent-cation tolerance protein CutA [Leptolyngbya cf. ectocarpi LEGE 11479]|uniref:Divalent-cation tolerance protein CutA n=1 Tax=Leptolyngbya cf. ectocarpi LEGE 11479 TaxID=1828722 RepID=A0A929F985_LEPEC|nr:divalent-cation tolerance protein CutA [Leptolyngbya cf. ectocarpi LEGE 11479]